MSSMRARSEWGRERWVRWTWAALASVPLAAGWNLFNARPLGPVVPVDRLAEVGTWLLLTLVCQRAYAVRSRLVWLCAALLAAFMAPLRMMSAHFQPLEPRPFTPWGWWPVELAVDWVVFTLVVAVVLRLLVACLRPAEVKPARSRGFWRPMVVAWGAMVVAWTPWLLIYWPGIMNRDSWSVLHQAMGLMPLTNHHPVVPTLYLEVCYKVARHLGWGPTGTILLHSITHIIMLAAALALVVAWAGLRFGRLPAWLTLGFFALNPMVGMRAITMTKDTMFVAWMVLLTLVLAEVSVRGIAHALRPAMLGALSVTLVGVAFTRNNGPYIGAAIVGLLTVLLIPRMLRRRLDALTLPAVGALVLAVILTIQGPGYAALGVKPGAHAEKVGLQIQQLAWANRYGTLTPEQKQTLAQVMPLERMRVVYTPTLVDSVKFDPSFRTDWLNEHPGEFNGLWREAMRANATGYFKAWYALAGGYVDPGRFVMRVDVGTKRGARTLVVRDHDLVGDALGIERGPQRVGRAVYIGTTLAPLSVLFSMPLVFWFAALAALAALLRRRPSRALPHLPFLLLVGTLLVAAPLTEFRYVVPGHVALPILVLCALGRPRVPAADVDAWFDSAGSQEEQPDDSPGPINSPGTRHSR